MAAKKKAPKRAVSRKSTRVGEMVDHDTFLLTMAGAVFLALVIVLVF